VLGECQEQHAKFYTAGVVLAFEHMHSKSAESLAPFLLCNLSANNNSNSLSRKKQLIQLTISTDLVIIQELGYSYIYKQFAQKKFMFLLESRCTRTKTLFPSERDFGFSHWTALFVSISRS